MFYWLEQQLVDVPAEDTWLSAIEWEQANALQVPKRRSEWRLGRWTAKVALARFYQFEAHPEVLASIELRTTPAGAPLLYYRGGLSNLSVSLSHSKGVALFVISPPGVKVGCDLEKIDPRSEAFIEDYCTESEIHLVEAVDPKDRPLLVNLFWSAKESVLKLLGIGLRADVRSISVSVDIGSLMVGREGWLAFTSRSTNAEVFHGIWRNCDEFVRTVVAGKPISGVVPLAEPNISRVDVQRQSIA